MAKTPKDFSTMIKMKKQGAVLQEIADHIGRSTSYVKNHLDNSGIDFKKKSEIEKDKVKPLAHRMKRKGHTLQEIADEIGRSTSYVKNMLDSLLDKETKKSENEFQKSDVLPFLKRDNHSNIVEGKPHKCGGIKLEIDIESTKNNITYYTEVKRDLGSHRLMTAIGQLVFHQFGNEGIPQNCRYQIALPRNYKQDKHFLEGLTIYLNAKLGIDVIFM